MSAILEQAPAPPIASQLRTGLAALRPSDAFSLDRPITIDEYCSVGELDGDYELLNGVVYRSPPSTDEHEDLRGWFFRVLGLYVEVRALGKVRGPRSGVRVGGGSLPEPDLLFFGNEHLDRMHPSGAHGTPDLAIEVVASDKARREAVRKQSQYQDVGVPEFWVVDLPRKEIRQFVLERGAYRQLPAPEDGEVAAVTVPGFHLQAAWLFAGPDFPSGLEVVTALLRNSQV